MRSRRYACSELYKATHGIHWYLVQVPVLGRWMESFDLTINSVLYPRLGSVLYPNTANTANTACFRISVPTEIILEKIRGNLKYAY